jgi:GTPase SAR1 family protein
MAHVIPIGTPIRIINSFNPAYSAVKATIGIVRAFDGTEYSVEFPSPFAGCHNCNNVIESGCGYYVRPDELSILAATIDLPEPLIAEISPGTTFPIHAPKKKKFTDELWEKIYATIAIPEISNILLYGPPGTGKTTALYNMAKGLFGEEKVYMTTSHDESIAEELTGHWMPRGGEFVWHNGFAVNAFKDGALIINEIDLAGGSYKTVLHSVLDDRSVACLRLPSGEMVHPHAQFKALATMNGYPEDLPEALRDRFDVKICVSRPSPEAMEALDDDLADIIKSSYSNPESITVSYRQARSFMDLRKHIPVEKAAEFVFGTNYSDILASIKLATSKGKK